MIGLRRGVIHMGKRTPWGRARHAYVCGDLSYREIAQKYGLPLRTVSEVGKNEEWPKKRKEYRDSVAAEAASRARARDVEALENVRQTADTLSGWLKKIVSDEKQLYMYAGPLRKASGAEQFAEKELTKANDVTLRTLGQALSEINKTVMSVYRIQSQSEEQAEALARERLELERERLELERERLALEREKAGDAGDAREIRVEIAEPLEEMKD